jgi:hypothetical protein
MEEWPTHPVKRFLHTVSQEVVHCRHPMMGAQLLMSRFSPRGQDKHANEAMHLGQEVKEATLFLCSLKSTTSGEDKDEHERVRISSEQ